MPAYLIRLVGSKLEGMPTLYWADCRLVTCGPDTHHELLRGKYLFNALFFPLLLVSPVIGHHNRVPTVFPPVT